jgi:glycosyltransferase involved in cell wall biosynthesis
MRAQKEVMKNWEGEDLKVSICCTAYNQEKYISEALDSFLMQETSFPFEIIVSDDCSTDGTTEIIKQYLGKYPDIIKLVYQDKNQYSNGALPIRDFILPEVKGKYIALCEGDDYWTDSTKLQQQIDFLDQNHEFIGCGHNTRFLVNGKLTDRLFIDLDAKKDEYTFDDFIDSTYLHTTSLVFRYNSEYKYRIDQYLEKYSSVERNDVYMLLIFSKFGPIKYIDKIMSVYRMNHGGVWSGANEQTQLVMFLRGCIDFSYIFDGKYKDKLLYSFVNTLSENFDDSASDDFMLEVLSKFSERDFKTIIESFAKYKKRDNETIKECSEYISFLEKQVNDSSFRSLIVKICQFMKIYPLIKKFVSKE